jgi:hypothetical protein
MQPPVLNLYQLKDELMVGCVHARWFQVHIMQPSGVQRKGTISFLKCVLCKNKKFSKVCCSVYRACLVCTVENNCLDGALNED